ASDPGQKRSDPRETRRNEPCPPVTDRRSREEEAGERRPRKKNSAQKQRRQVASHTLPHPPRWGVGRCCGIRAAEEVLASLRDKGDPGLAATLWVQSFGDAENGKGELAHDQCDG